MGFYCIGYYYWGYEGDFFGLYLEVNYGLNIDIYNGIVFFGFEVELKRDLKGFKIVFGFELWWGVNFVILIKYYCKFGKYDVIGIFYEDVDCLGNIVSLFVILML